MDYNIQKFIAHLHSRPGATEASIAESERQLQRTLPKEYLDFLKLTNGGEGFIGNTEYVVLWSVEQLAPMNQSYEVYKYAAELLVFGTDGGDEAYGFDARLPEWMIVRVPFVGMDWSNAQPIGRTFNSFLQRLYEVD